ncbi:hypothetical protein [Pseudomonas serbica]|uniref:hypothetical protein n=1 Tax=Pseudomonas serbica TaxID=2965074 RepID=UPI00237C3885|nr:hypothetical protein [Pseudomonas serbica]
MSDDTLVKIPREALLDLISVARSVNRGKQHEVRLPGEDEPCYWQRKEWVDWAVEAGELVAAEMKRLNPESILASKPTTEQEIAVSAESDARSWIEFSLGGERWSFDGDQLVLWDGEEELFMFHSYHGLAEPTKDTVIAYVNQLLSSKAGTDGQ